MIAAGLAQAGPGSPVPVLWGPRAGAGGAGIRPAGPHEAAIPNGRPAPAVPSQDRIRLKEYLQYHLQGVHFISARMALRERCARVSLLATTLVAAAGAASGDCTRATAVRSSRLVGRRPRSVIPNAAGLVEGGELHDAARDGDLAAVEARPPASTVCGSCSFALSRPRLQRLLTPGLGSGPTSVNEKNKYGYSPAGFFPSARCSNSTHSQIRPVLMPTQVPYARGKYIQFFSRTSLDASVHKLTHICIR